MIPRGPGGYTAYRYSCYCSDYDPVTIEGGTSLVTSCYQNLMYYTHSAAAQASGLARRRNRDRLARRQLEPCPQGLTACATDGAGGYECLDTMNDLDSCGGCTGATFGNASAATGVDCNTLPGVALGGTTCAAGVCNVYACLTGYDLVDGTCVPTALLLQA
ncbi:hypothetical protein Q5752_005510 [Cryptotrichosporon argae]